MLGMVVGLVIAIAAGSIAYFIVGPKIVRAKVDGIVAEAVGQAIECAVAVEAEGAVPEPAIHEIHNIVVNPAGGRGYLLVSLGIEVASEEEAQKLAGAEVVVRDAILRELASRSATDLSTERQDGSLGLRIGELIGEEIGVEVRRVLFPQFVIQ